MISSLAFTLLSTLVSFLSSAPPALVSKRKVLKKRQGHDSDARESMRSP